MSRPKEKSVKQSLYNATENKMLTNMRQGAAKVPRTHARKMTVCSFKSAGAEKDEPDSYLTYNTRTNSKWPKDLRVSPETMEVLADTRTLCRELGGGISDMP